MTQTAQSFTPEERQKYLGASEIAAVMGLSPYKSPLEVYNEKLGLAAPFTGNAHTERGNRLEQIAAEFYTDQTGKRLMRRNAALTHPEYDFIKGHIDRKIVGEDALAEIKCPSVGAYWKYQREGLPQSMIVQMQVYLGLAGYDRGVFIIFCADQWDAAIFEVEFSVEIYDEAVRAAADFWNYHIIAKEPPDPNKADKASIEFEKVGGDLIVRTDEEFCSAVEMLREAAQIKADGEYLYDEAKKAVIKAISDAPGRYEGNGVRIAYSEVAGRVTFDKKAFQAANPEIDLEPFHKQGRPYKMFRPYFKQGD